MGSSLSEGNRSELAWFLCKPTDAKVAAVRIALRDTSAATRARPVSAGRLWSDNSRCTRGWKADAGGAAGVAVTRKASDRDVDLREKAAVAGADPKQIGSVQVRGRASMVSPATSQRWPRSVSSCFRMPAVGCLGASCVPAVRCEELWAWSFSRRLASWFSASDLSMRAAHSASWAERGTWLSPRKTLRSPPRGCIDDERRSPRKRYLSAT